MIKFKKSKKYIQVINAFIIKLLIRNLRDFISIFLRCILIKEICVRVLRFIINNWVERLTISKIFFNYRKIFNKDTQLSSIMLVFITYKFNINLKSNISNIIFLYNIFSKVSKLRLTKNRRKSKIIILNELDNIIMRKIVKVVKSMLLSSSSSYCKI